MNRSNSGRKREWQSMESSSHADDEHTYEASNSHGSYTNDTRRPNGEVIENEMKRLRLAHDYDASLSVWHTANQSAIDVPMDGDTNPHDISTLDSNHNYTTKNNLLRECHYLRQLRKFQSERLHARASFTERRGLDTQTQLVPPPPRF